MAGFGGMSFNPPPGPASDWLSNFIHWAWYGKQNGAGLGAVPGQLASSMDPRSRAGLVNLASMFAPGGGKFDASGQLGEMGMPGEFEAYSSAKAAAGGHLSSDTQAHGVSDLLRYANHSPNVGQQVNAASMLHDLLFGGEVHAKGDIPMRPSEVHVKNLMKDIKQRSGVEPPKNTEDAVQSIADKLGIHRSKVEAQMKAAERANKIAARQRANAQTLRNHGFSQHPSEHLHETLDERAQAGMGDTSHTRTAGQKAHATTNIFHPALRAQRQAALRRMLAQQQHNHRN